VAIDEAWVRFDRKPVWLLKIDTERAEADILEGTPADFLGAVRNAIVEYHDSIVRGALARCQRVLARLVQKSPKYLVSSRADF
jgi:hypothetical protein